MEIPNWGEIANLILAAIAVAEYVRRGRQDAKRKRKRKRK